jgi:hypothetical protein
VRSRTSTRSEINTVRFETFNGYIRKMLLAMVDRDETAEKMRDGGVAVKERFDAWRLGLGSWIRSGSKDQGEYVGSMKRMQDGWMRWKMT